MSSVSFKDVEDVLVRKKGLWANLFNYGDVIIQNKTQQFVIDVPKINYPQELLTLLQDTGQQYRQDRKLLNITR